MFGKKIEKLKICIKEENTIVAFLKNVKKSETLKNIRAKCNKITDKYLFCDGDDILDLELESTLEIGDIINAEGKIFIEPKEQPKEKELSDTKRVLLNL